MKILLALIVSMILYSCKNEKRPQTLREKQSEIESGVLDSTNQYYAEQVGWKINIMKDWEIITRQTNQQNQSKGKKAMEEVLGQEIETDGLIQLLNIQKGKFNNLLSTIQAFDEAKDGPYEETNALVYDMIKQTYTGKGMVHDLVKDSAFLDGLRFNVLHVTVYKDSDRSNVLLRQSMYSRLLNGYDLGINISYMDEAAGKELEAMVRSSTFSKRN